MRSTNKGSCNFPHVNTCNSYAILKLVQLSHGNKSTNLGYHSIAQHIQELRVFYELFVWRAHSIPSVLSCVRACVRAQKRLMRMCAGPAVITLLGWLDTVIGRLCPQEKNG